MDCEVGQVRFATKLGKPIGDSVVPPSGLQAPEPRGNWLATWLPIIAKHGEVQICSDGDTDPNCVLLAGRKNCNTRKIASLTRLHGANSLTDWLCSFLARFFCQQGIKQSSTAVGSREVCFGETPGGHPQILDMAALHERGHETVMHMSLDHRQQSVRPKDRPPR